MKLTILSGGLLLLVFLAACSGLLPASISSPKGNLTPTSVPVTETPTTTIVWFPPTNTPSLFPTQAVLPTPQQRPGLGEMLFSDPFDQPDLWSTSTSSLASAKVTSSKLLLSISGQGPLSVASLRNQPVLGDFYAEATAALSLCGEMDQFGMIFRAIGDNYYRFTVRCDGQMRLERSISGSKSPLGGGWLASGDAPGAAPARVKLGVWAAGSEMRFFLNDNYQFSVQDSTLHAGTLGFFVYANGATPITVSFSSLSVFPVIFISPTPSLSPSRTPTSSRTPVPTQTSTPDD